jgi:transposase
MWCVAELDEDYIQRMEDLLAVYEKPLSEREPVVCIDEKPVVLHADLRPPLPLRPGRRLRRDSEYEGCGTANTFCGVEPKAGRHFTKATPDRSSPQFADYLLEIAEHYPGADTIHLVMDNLSSHTRKAVVERFGEQAGDWLWERFTVHYTPTHGSWLNQAEIEISLFRRQCLGRRRIPSLAHLRREAGAWNRRMNRARVPLNWRFTRSKARQKFGYKRNHIMRSET